MPFIQIMEGQQREPADAARILRAVTDAYAEASGTAAAKTHAILVPVARTHWAVGSETLQDRDLAGGHR